MNIIIPMAGRGSRLRPHTLTVPKPLVPIAGKPMVQRLVEDFTSSCLEDIDEIAFVIGDFGKEVEGQLLDIAASVGAKGSVFTQDQPLGTAHAILCARETLRGHCVIAFADTLFDATFDFDTSKDGYIWVEEVEDPSAFGVVKLNNEGEITDFVEKPETPVSNLAIVGLYYVRDGEGLRDEMQYLIDNDIKEKGEYQLTNALENLKKKGVKFYPAKIDEWLDCGNKDAVVFTNQRILELKKGKEKLVHESVQIENSIIIEPCFVGENTKLTNCVIGPHVSIGSNCKVKNSVIKNSVIQNEVFIENANFAESMLGNQSTYVGKRSEVSIGDYSKHKE